MKKQDLPLIEAAIEASKRAYAPYSRFQVGAALLLSDGTIVQGCNVENASYGLTNCAERTAVFSAVAQGRRDFTRMAIFVDTEMFISPCGACRQVLWEWAPELQVILATSESDYRRLPLRELLPHAFDDGCLRHD